MKRIACVRCKRVRWAKTAPSEKGAFDETPRHPLCLRCRPKTKKVRVPRVKRAKVAPPPAPEKKQKGRKERKGR
jgi:hypothetical protein